MCSIMHVVLKSFYLLLNDAKCRGRHEDQPAHVPPATICNSLEEADSEAQQMVTLPQGQEDQPAHVPPVPICNSLEDRGRQRSPGNGSPSPSSGIWSW